MIGQLICDLLCTSNHALVNQRSGRICVNKFCEHDIARRIGKRDRSLGVIAVIVFRVFVHRGFDALGNLAGPEPPGFSSIFRIT